jgi:parvulin-like peptidyl-prolyl isomerase
MYPMKRLAAALVAAIALPAMGQKPDSTPPSLPPADTPLVVDGNVRVEAADFEGSILRVPADRRAAFRVSYDRVVSVVDSVFVARSLAQKARDAGLDADPAVQARMRQLQDAFLADLYAQHLEKQDTAAAAGLESRAREIYAADKEKFMTDEEAHVQQILIGVSCRTRPEARTLAQAAHQEAKSGKDFLELATKYSDTGEKVPKGGDIGTGPVKRLVQPVRDALAKLKPGEISEPVESTFGYHVLKLIERKPAQPKPFDSVKQEIIAAEKDKLNRKRIEDTVFAMRNSKTVVTHRENIEKLVAPGADIEELARKAREASRAPAKPAPAKK